MNKEIAVGPTAVKAYIDAHHGNICPLSGCGGSVDGTGAQEWREDEIAVGRAMFPHGARKWSRGRNGDQGPERDGGYCLAHRWL